MASIISRVTIKLRSIKAVKEVERKKNNSFGFKQSKGKKEEKNKKKYKADRTKNKHWFNIDSNTQ